MKSETTAASTRVPSVLEPEAKPDMVDDAVHTEKDVAASSDAASASDNNVAPAAATSSSADEDEYPTGFRLVATILALIFSIFLASLDMVRFSFFGFISL